jgi:hypothetical protein
MPLALERRPNAEPKFKRITSDNTPSPFTPSWIHKTEIITKKGYAQNSIRKTLNSTVDLRNTGTIIGDKKYIPLGVIKGGSKITLITVKSTGDIPPEVTQISVVLTNTDKTEETGLVEVPTDGSAIITIPNIDVKPTETDVSLVIVTTTPPSYVESTFFTVKIGYTVL